MQLFVPCSFHNYRKCNCLSNTKSYCQTACCNSSYLKNFSLLNISVGTGVPGTGAAPHSTVYPEPLKNDAASQPCYTVTIDLKSSL
jgi:hypothetical protein